ncbi:MAG: hypothetical protein WC849_02355 [Candidatus Paceibacterota bacterium]
MDIPNIQNKKKEKTPKYPATSFSPIVNVIINDMVATRKRRKPIDKTILIVEDFMTITPSLLLKFIS